MVWIIAPNEIDPTGEHYLSVLDEMRERGAPVIRCLPCPHGWLAIEGSHRLAAAAELGLMPVLEEISLDADDLEDIDLDCEPSAQEILDYLSADGYRGCVSREFVD